MSAPGAVLIPPVNEAAAMGASAETLQVGPVEGIDAERLPDAASVLEAAEQILADALVAIDDALAPESLEELESNARGVKRNGSEEVNEWDKVPE